MSIFLQTKQNNKNCARLAETKPGENKIILHVGSNRLANVRNVLDDYITLASVSEMNMIPLQYSLHHVLPSNITILTITVQSEQPWALGKICEYLSGRKIISSIDLHVSQNASSASELSTLSTPLLSGGNKL